MKLLPLPNDLTEIQIGSILYTATSKAQFEFIKIRRDDIECYLVVSGTGAPVKDKVRERRLLPIHHWRNKLKYVPSASLVEDTRDYLEALHAATT